MYVVTTLITIRRRKGNDFNVRSRAGEFVRKRLLLEGNSSETARKRSLYPSVWVSCGPSGTSCANAVCCIIEPPITRKQWPTASSEDLGKRLKSQHTTSLHYLLFPVSGTDWQFPASGPNAFRSRLLKISGRRFGKTTHQSSHHRSWIHRMDTDHKQNGCIGLDLKLPL